MTPAESFEGDHEDHEYAVLIHNFEARRRTLLLRSVRLANEIRTLRSDLTERTAEREALAATVERLIREAGAVRLEERQRITDDRDEHVSNAHQRLSTRCAEQEQTIADLRRIVDHADLVVADNDRLRSDLDRARKALAAAEGKIAHYEGPDRWSER